MAQPFIWLSTMVGGCARQREQPTLYYKTENGMGTYVEDEGVSLLPRVQMLRTNWHSRRSRT